MKVCRYPQTVRRLNFNMSFSKADYFRYLKSPAWQAKRQKRIKIDGHRCCMCGRTDEETILTVHHIRYNTFQNEDPYRDLITLCENCHTSVHVLMNRVTGINPDGSIRHGWKTDLPAGIREALMERGLME